MKRFALFVGGLAVGAFLTVAPFAHGLGLGGPLNTNNWLCVNPHVVTHVETKSGPGGGTTLTQTTYCESVVDVRPPNNTGGAQ